MALKVPTVADSKNKKDTAYTLVFSLGKSMNRKINSIKILDNEINNKDIPSIPI